MSKKKKRKAKAPIQLTHPTQVELAKMLAKARKEAEEALQRVHIIGGSLQATIDEANVTQTLTPYLQPQDTEGLINIWASVANQASKVNMDLDNIQPTTDAVNSTATVSTTIISGSYTNNRLYEDNPEFQSAWLPYVEFISRPSQKDNTIQLLQEFGLDIPHQPNEKSPLELFETAHEAFARPIIMENNPVSTSLIPLRGCIENSVQSLLLMRSRQEATKGWKRKIASIGKQLKKR
jgi:hypothetical protein